MQFKTLVLATSSLVALGLAIAPASAKSGMTGTVNLGTGHTWQDFDEGGGFGIDQEFMNIFGGAQVNIPASDNVNVQLDVNGDAAYANEEDTENFSSAVTIGGHINYSNEDGFLGVYGATGRLSHIDDDAVSFFAGGLEGQLTGSSWLAGVQVGWLDTCCDQSPPDDASESLTEAGFARVSGTWFANNKLAIGGSFAFLAGTQGSDFDEVELMEWTASAEKMIGKNTSVAIIYRGVDVENRDDDSEVDSHTVSAEFTFHFNATDLYTSAVDGPSAPALPFARWVAEAGQQLDL